MQHLCASDYIELCFRQGIFGSKFYLHKWSQSTEKKTKTFVQFLFLEQLLYSAQHQHFGNA